MPSLSPRCFLLVALCAAALCGSSSAQPTTPDRKPEMRENCPGLVAGDQPRVIPTSFPASLPASLLPTSLLAALNPDQVRITFSGHATFQIESPKSVRVATDYNDYIQSWPLPDIATMNHAHNTHYTDKPDPDIKFVLRGWRDDGKPANHDVTYADVRVRSVSTNIRDWNGGTEFNGNSIFIFEVAHMCIAHLGHLHHTLTQQQLDDMGRIDILLVPVDGGYTMDIEGMIEVIHAIKAPLMVPMHYFSTSTLRRFLDRVAQDYDVEYSDSPTFTITKTTLPTKGRFLVLPGH